MRGWTTTAAVRRAAAATAMVLVAAACTAPPGGGGPTTTPPPTTQPPLDDEPFTVVVIGDPEARMRGNTNEEVAGYVRDLADYRTTTVEYFDHDGGTHRIDPELVLLAGDISADRGTSVDADMPLYQPLYDAGIAMVAAFGNHDWEPVTFSDGSPGYSVAGHLSNESTNAFTRETYRRSAQLGADFRYREVGPASVHGPAAFHATYRGVEIVNLGSYLYQPSYRYPDGWPLSCNLLAGGAGCQIFVSAEAQIERMEALLTPEDGSTALFLQHYPLTTASNWWDDQGASGTTLEQRRQRLLGLMDRYEDVALVAGHNHVAAQYGHPVGDRVLPEYVTPYFGGFGTDPTAGGGFWALLVSPTQGILEARVVDP